MFSWTGSLSFELGTLAKVSQVESIAISQRSSPTFCARKSQKSKSNRLGKILKLVTKLGPDTNSALKSSERVRTPRHPPPVPRAQKVQRFPELKAAGVVKQAVDGLALIPRVDAASRTCC